MPRDSSGNYTLPIGNPVVDGTVISTDWANPTMNDIAVQLNNVLTRDGLLGYTVPNPVLPDFANTADPTKGDALVGVKQPFAGAVARTQHDKNAETISIKDFGVVGDGVTDDTVAFQAFLNQVNTSGRIGIIADGSFLVTALELFPTKNIDLVFEGGASIIGAAGSSAPVLLIDGGVTRPRVSINGMGRIDNSRRTYIPATASGTALEIRRCTQFISIGVHYDAGNSYAAAVGDSGIAAQEVDIGYISMCKFTGQADIGIYLTGGGLVATSDDSGRWVISENYFSQCVIAASARRQMDRVSFINNIVEDCRQGFQTAEAGSGGTIVPPAREVIVSGNHFARINTRSVELRWAQEGSVISGNTIVDNGNATDIAWPAVSLLGCRGVATFGNTLAVRSYTVNAGASGFACSNFTIDGVTKNSSDNIFFGNTIRDYPFGFVDNSAGTNISVDNVMVGVTTHYSGAGTPMSFRRVTATGEGFGTASPAARIHAVGFGRFERILESSQYAQIEQNPGYNEFRSYSSAALAKGMRLRATTDDANTIPTSGSVTMQLDVLGAIGMQIGQAREIFFPGISTTASAANAFLNSGSTPANQLLRSTSSGVYKTDVEEIDVEHALEVYEKLRGVWYRSLAEADRKDWSWYGYIAEEVAEIDPRLVFWGYQDADYDAITTMVEKTVIKNGNEVTELVPEREWRLKPDAVKKPDGVMYERVAVLSMVAERYKSQLLENRVSDLEARLKKIEQTS